MKSLRSTLIIGSLVAGLGVLNSGAALASFEGFGSDIPLESAAKQIVPDGYSVDYGAGVDKSVAVSWGSANDWQGALSSALGKKGLKAEIGTGTVMIVKAPATSAAPRPYSSTPSSDMVQKKNTDRKSAPRPQRVEPRDPSQRETASVGGGGFTIKPYREPSKPAGELKGKDFSEKKDFEKYEGKGQFIVEEGYMLHGTLSTWAEATGWKVIWNSQHDYLIEANATFTGDFVKASSDLIHAMRDARPQITVDYYQGNKVIVVSNKLSDEVNR